jgi:hypothetical protein
LSLAVFFQALSPTAPVYADGTSGSSGTATITFDPATGATMSATANPGAAPAQPGPVTRPSFAPSTSSTPIPAPSFAPASIPVGSTTEEGDAFKILKLKNADAATTVAQLNSLLPPDRVTVISDARTNTLMLRGAPSALKEVESLVNQLDEAETHKPAGQGVTNVNPNPFGGGGGGIGGGFGGGGFGAAGPFAPKRTNSGNQTSGTVTLTVPAWQNYADAVSNFDVHKDEWTKSVSDLAQKLADAKSAGKSDDAAALQEKMKKLVDEQARAVEQQARQAEQQIRQAEQQLRLAQQQMQQQQAQAAVQKAQVFAKWAEQSGRSSEQARRAAELQQRIEATVHSIQDFEKDSDLSAEQKAGLDKLKKELKDQLSNQFDTLQKAESEELEQLRQRLDKLQKEIDDHAKNRDDFIKHRIDDLMSSPAGQSADQIRGQFFSTDGKLIIEDLPGGRTLQLDAVPNGTITFQQVAVPPTSAPPGAVVPPVVPAPPAAAKQRKKESKPAPASDDAKDKNDSDSSENPKPLR